MIVLGMKRKKLKIKGIVQGVGFRPFIYSLASRYGLNGFVLNDTEGVVVEIEGRKTGVEKFILDITKKIPPLSRIEEINISELPPVGYSNFTIKPSAQKEERFVLISPDIATCDDCLKELFDPRNRRFHYPFTNCTNCGPRFTIIKGIPYDRPKTTMESFKMCDECQFEYDDPLNRRFHAQPNCCSRCGPHLSLVDKRGKEIIENDVMKKTIELLKKGKIVAVKGLGGFHLACDAMDKSAVRRLRERKGREDKPFAIMVKNVQTAKRFCRVNKAEKEMLLSKRRPIVLLSKNGFCPIVDDVAPRQKYLGVMLPYTPLHHLLSSELEALVMTSGNISNEPIVFKNEDAVVQLKDIADYFLLHNRNIHIRCDDSVARIFNGKEMLIRRSRGYVPEPIEFPYESQILACGAELKNTFCLTRDNYGFLSHYIGDLENSETFEAFSDGIKHFKNLFSIEPEIIAYDLHPEYLSTKYAKQLLENDSSLTGIPVQHHHAHIASCMLDNHIEERVIGVAFDGLGFGIDGNLWGGEFLTADFKGFHREAHFKYIPTPGAVQAIKEPYRMAVAYLLTTYGEDFNKLNIGFLKRIGQKKIAVIKEMIFKGINSPVTSSVGRLFDAVSSLLGICDIITYEGQAAIELEMAVSSPYVYNSRRIEYNYIIENKNDMYIIEPEVIISGIVEDIKKDIPQGFISLKFHNTIVNIIVDACVKIREKTDIKNVALTGGVFQNIFLLKRTMAQLQNRGFIVFTHHRVPTNDGGISVGQAVIAGCKVTEA